MDAAARCPTVKNFRSKFDNVFILILFLVTTSWPGAALADEGFVRVTRADCDRITRHVPGADVAYRPGVDPRGRAVAPAELGGETGRIDVAPDSIRIPITRPLRQFFGVPGNTAQFETRGARVAPFAAEAEIGVVTIREGRAYFNDTSLADPAAHAIAEACRQQQTRR